MVNVPRVYLRFAASIKAKIAQAADSMNLINEALVSSLRSLIGKGLGLDLCRTMVSGSTPIDPLL
jgi:long-subunit acyl-CoA synthetase (AMP-forming)